MKFLKRVWAKKLYYLFSLVALAAFLVQIYIEFSVAVGYSNTYAKWAGWTGLILWIIVTVVLFLLAKFDAFDDRSILAWFIVSLVLTAFSIHGVLRQVPFMTGFAFCLDLLVWAVCFYNYAKAWIMKETQEIGCSDCPCHRHVWEKAQ